MSIWAHSSRGALAVKSVCIVRRQLWHFRIFGQLSLGTLRFYTFRKLGILKLKYLSRKVFVNLTCSLDSTSNSNFYFTNLNDYFLFIWYLSTFPVRILSNNQMEWSSWQIPKPSGFSGQNSSSTKAQALIADWHHLFSKEAFNWHDDVNWQ